MDSGVKIAICGKGGVGKTTLCAVWARLFAEDGFEVLVIDADANSNLASAFGIPRDQSPQPLIRMKELIAERTGTDKASMGAYFKLNPAVSDLPEQYWLKINEHLRLLVLGDITQAGAGCACPESAFLKAMLSHIVLRRKELVLVDLAAGVEFMGRATVQGVDVLVVVVEPGSRSIDTANNIVKMARQLGTRHLAVIANKVTSAEQTELVETKFKDIPVLAGIQYFPAVQQADLQRADVFNSCEDLVNTLRQAKDRLMDLVNIKVESS